MMYRRSVLKGMAALFIAPAIIRAESLMPIKEYMPAVPAWCPDGWIPLDGREISKKFYPDLYAAYKRMKEPLVVPNVYSYLGVSGYEYPKGVQTVMSYKNMVRPNGRLMIAGAHHPIYVPEEIKT